MTTAEQPEDKSPYDKERYAAAMWEQPSYPASIHFRVNFWKNCLDYMSQNNLFDKGLDDPSVSTFIKSLNIVHGSFKKHDDLLLSSAIHGKPKMHSNADPSEKMEYVFFRVEQVPTNHLDPMSAQMHNDFIKYGTSDYYGPYVHTSPFTSILDQEGMITPIDNLKNFTPKPGEARGTTEEFAYQTLFAMTMIFLQKNPPLLNAIGEFYPEYSTAAKGDITAASLGIYPGRRSFASKMPGAAAMDLKDFSAFFKKYPLLALLVFPPPFAEVLIKDKFRPQNTEYRPVENARSIEHYPDDYKNMLLGVMTDDPFAS